MLDARNHISSTVLRLFVCRVGAANHPANPTGHNHNHAKGQQVVSSAAHCARAGFRHDIRHVSTHLSRCRKNNSVFIIEMIMASWKLPPCVIPAIFDQHPSPLSPRAPTPTGWLYRGSLDLVNGSDDDQRPVSRMGDSVPCSLTVPGIQPSPPSAHGPAGSHGSVPQIRGTEPQPSCLLSTSNLLNPTRQVTHIGQAYGIRLPLRETKRATYWPFAWVG